MMTRLLGMEERYRVLWPEQRGGGFFWTGKPARAKAWKWTPGVRSGGLPHRWAAAQVGRECSGSHTGLKTLGKILSTVGNE